MGSVVVCSDPSLTHREMHLLVEYLSGRYTRPEFTFLANVLEPSLEEGRTGFRCSVIVDAEVRLLERNGVIARFQGCARDFLAGWRAHRRLVANSHESLRQLGDAEERLAMLEHNLVGRRAEPPADFERPLILE